MLKHNMTKYKLIEEQRKAFKNGDLELASMLFRFIRKGETRIGLADDTGFKLECIAESCGCRISYSRSYSSAYIRF